MMAKFATLGTLIVVLGVVVPYAGGQTCSAPPLGLVSWWTGDGTILDFLGQNNGLATSQVSFAAGEVADGFSLNGTQYLQVTRSASLEPATVSVDAWVNATAPGPGKYILSKGGTADIAASYGLYTGMSAAGGLQFYVYDGTGPTSYHLSPDAGGAVWDGNWHHVAGTYDGSAVHLFVDGKEVGTATPTTAAIAYGLSDTNDLFIGDYNPNCASCVQHHFTGKIDEVQVFQRALAASDVASVFAAGQAGECLPVQIKVGLNLIDILDLLLTGRLDVDILGSPAFNTGSVAQSTMLISPAPTGLVAKEKITCISQDVNGDKISDLVCLFPINVLQLIQKPTVLVDGQVSVPGGTRTFYGVETLH